MSELTENLPAGWCRDASGALRRETAHSMLRRLPNWDYRQRAIYQITITLADRSSRALGRLEVWVGGAWVVVEETRGCLAARGQEQSGGRAGGGQEQNGGQAGDEAALRPERVVARVVASEIGAAVERLWRELPAQWPGVSIIAGQLMPDHFHGVIFVEKPQVKTLGNIIGSFKSKTASWAKGFCSLSRATEYSLWSPGYQDTILFRAGQLANMKRYLADNPRRLAIKRLCPDLFCVVRELALPLNWGDGRRLVGRFAALGNRFLLSRSLEQVQVSRRDFAYRREKKPGGGLKIARNAAGEPIVDFAAPVFAAKRDLLLAAAKHGAVLVSPCVSDGEREIARLALAAGWPLVTLHNKGFSPLQKPNGRYFDACADGRLLMLAPAAWPYQPGEKPMTRADATAMNRLCQGLIGEDAVEINYHGMKPKGIDALAWAAAQVAEEN